MKKIIAFLKRRFGKKSFNTGFAEKNQPCYDKNGNFIGWFSRSMAAALFLFMRNKEGKLHVLASERGTGAADFNGYWNCTCGYLDYGETTKQCAIRELEEETGIGISEDIIQFIGYEDSPSANHQNVTFRFGAFDPNNVIENLSSFSKKHNEKNEVGEIKWVPVDEIDNYKWAFGHKERIREVGKAMGLLT